ncbi:hypothetical protein H2198_002167 [Neophaeococcomyces mojaviensis]|uniref:Uncharacterized protein n=1 Tax=Neophaeococcomyces mojaviensis TaxID=3383035 RepID=A0ACC3AEV5_9EURO|nr:hypothetical protein H2198_002167 [Knufia sp. JES_112]
MSDLLSTAAKRLSQTTAMLTGKTQDPKSIPWNPDSTFFPPRSAIISQPGEPDGACWVWGKDDSCGRLNLLTPQRVLAASKLIQTGESAPLDLPSNIPAQPSFGRPTFKHELSPIAEGRAYDDVYIMNTQSGTQWDGFRHVAHQPTTTFYNNTKHTDFSGPNFHSDKCSVHKWREHGMTGRGILLDYRRYATSKGIRYDTATPFAISYDELVACGKWQNLDIRPASAGGDIQPGDLLFIRSGWVQDYYGRSDAENARLALREHADLTWAGVKQEPAMIDWLHDCYFAAVGGDAPSFEKWPTSESYMLHEYLLAMWGVPIGEMVDLERVSELCAKHNRYAFFVTSAPFRTVGGVASWLNATAIF